MAWDLKDKLFKKRGLTFWKVVLALAFGFGSSVYIWRPTVLELKEMAEKRDAEERRDYTI